MRGRMRNEIIAVFVPHSTWHFQRIIPLVIIAIVISTPIIFAQSSTSSYQAGAEGYMAARTNLGVSASIQTHIYDIDNPTLTDRSDLFFVGSHLVNGAFVQFGYGFEPGLLCLRAYFQLNGTGTCMGGWQVIQNGDARWFWEYWPDWQGRLGVYTQIGPSMSAGADGTLHVYAISGSSNLTWSFILDGRQVASLNVTPSIATDNPYVAAEQVTSQQPGELGPVRFQNLSYFSSGVWLPVEFLKRGGGCGSFDSPGHCPYATPYNVTLIGENEIIAGSLTPTTGQSRTTSINTSLTASNLHSVIDVTLVGLVVAAVVVIGCYARVRRNRKHHLSDEKNSEFSTGMKRFSKFCSHTGFNMLQETGRSISLTTHGR